MWHYHSLVGGGWLGKKPFGAFCGARHIFFGDIFFFFLHNNNERHDDRGEWGFTALLLSLSLSLSLALSLSLFPCLRREEGGERGEKEERVHGFWLELLENLWKGREGALFTRFASHQEKTPTNPPPSSSMIAVTFMYSIGEGSFVVVEFYFFYSFLLFPGVPNKQKNKNKEKKQKGFSACKEIAGLIKYIFDSLWLTSLLPPPSQPQNFPSQPYHPLLVFSISFYLFLLVVLSYWALFISRVSFLCNAALGLLRAGSRGKPLFIFHLSILSIFSIFFFFFVLGV